MRCAVRNVDSATCTVHESWSCAITNGQRNWFQLVTNAITPSAAKNPVEFGTTTRQ